MRANFESRATFGAGAILSTLTCATANKQTTKQTNKQTNKAPSPYIDRSATCIGAAHGPHSTAQLISTQHSSTQHSRPLSRSNGTPTKAPAAHGAWHVPSLQRRATRSGAERYEVEVV